MLRAWLALVFSTAACSGVSAPAGTVVFEGVEFEEEPCGELTCLTLVATTTDGDLDASEGSCRIIANYGDEEGYTAATTGPLRLLPGARIEWTVGLSPPVQEEFTEFGVLCTPILEG